MPRNGVTYEDVENACVHLIHEGNTASIENVRRKLGTGSSNTIAKHLRHWRSHFVHPVKEEITPPATLAHSIHQVWDQLSKDANERVEAIATLAQILLLKLISENEKLRQSNRHWQELHNSWVNQKKGFLENNCHLESTLNDWKVECENLRNEKNSLISLLSEKQSRIDELLMLHKQVQTNLEHFRHESRLHTLNLEISNDNNVATIKKNGETTLSAILQLSELINHLMKNGQMQSLNGSNTYKKIIEIQQSLNDKTSDTNNIIKIVSSIKILLSKSNEEIKNLSDYTHKINNEVSGYKFDYKYFAGLLTRLERIIDKFQVIEP